MDDSRKISRALPIGTEIESDTDVYTIDSVLGSGGFGVTYKVVRRSDSRVFALKECFPKTLCERAPDNTMSYLKTNAETVEGCIRNFMTEARRFDRHNISHPNIVKGYEVFEANHTAYFVMEYVEGQSLHRYVKSRNGRPLSAGEAMAIMRPIMEAVSYLHDNRLTHLDIKPDNIILETGEKAGIFRPVVIDFGQSKHYDHRGNATSTLTNAGCSEGFAPPEQYAGLTRFTPKADIYALGATMLYLLTAQQPPKSTEITASDIVAMLPMRTPKTIENAIIEAMQTDMRSRTPSVRAFASALGIDLNIASGGKATEPIGVIRHRNRKYSTPMMLLFYIVVAVVVAGIVWYAARPTDTPSQRLTKAIMSEDRFTLIEFANVDSLRACLPLALIYKKYGDSENAVFFAKKALNYPADSEMAADFLQHMDSDAVERVLYVPSEDFGNREQDSGGSAETVADKSDSERLEEANTGGEEKPTNNANKQEETVSRSVETTTPSTTVQDKPDKTDYYSMTIGQLDGLARKGDTKAYAPLAVKCYNAGQNSKALRYAQRAQNSGTATPESDEICRKLAPKN
jgi:serine/threonine protein kinase